MTDLVTDRSVGTAAVLTAQVGLTAEAGDQSAVEVISMPCVYCRGSRSSPSTVTTTSTLIVAAVADVTGARIVRPEVIVRPEGDARLELAALAMVERAVRVPVTCLVCRLDFEVFADPTEAAYFSRIHNEMHHGAWRWAHPVH
jgi:hypothetical protein